MSVYWDDYRDGSRSSHWRVQGELSKKGVKDYNVQDYKYLAKLDYGPNKGSRNISTEESNANTQLAKTESTYGIPTTITFNDYLSFDEFSDFCTNMPVDVVKLQLRGLTSSGERVSIFTRTDKGLDETEALIREQLEKGSMSFEGITSVYPWCLLNILIPLVNSLLSILLKAIIATFTQKMELMKMCLTPI